MNRNAVLISLLVLLFLGGAGCSSDTPFAFHGELLEFGTICNIQTARPEAPRPDSHVRVGLPFWIDLQEYNAVQGLAFAPLLVYADSIVGVETALIAGAGEFHGVQLAPLCAFSWNSNGVAAAPVIFSGGGRCVQIGVLVVGGLGYGSLGSLGQYGVFCWSGHSAYSSILQTGLVAIDHSCERNDVPATIQCGVFTLSARHVDKTRRTFTRRSQYRDRKIQIGLLNWSADSECASLQIGLLNVSTNAWCPVMPLINWYDPAPLNTP